MRLLLASHLLQLLNVHVLLSSGSFQLRDVFGLLLPQIFEPCNLLITSLDLIFEHCYVRLKTLIDFTLSLDFRLNGTQVLQFDLLRLEASLFVLLGRLVLYSTLFLLLYIRGGVLHLLLVLFLHSINF